MIKINSFLIKFHQFHMERKMLSFEFARILMLDPKEIQYHNGTVLN